MVRRNVTYQNPIHQEENTPLVTILETRIDTKQSTAVDSRQAAYVIDLAKASFGGIYYPIPGSQWYLKKISSVWTLMARAPQQNPQLNPSFAPLAGETYIGSEGATHVAGSLSTVGSNTADGFHAVGDSSTDEAHTAMVIGDSFKRLIIRDSGDIEWGSGSATQDTKLYRYAASQIGSDDDVVLPSDSQQFIVGNPATTGTASFYATRGAVGDDLVASRVSGDANSRFITETDGRHLWGPGSATQDTNLYRSAADTLKTDDSFIVGGNLTVTGDATDVLPLAKVISNAAVTSGNDSTSSGTFANCAGTGSVTSMSFTKQYGTTSNLMISLHATFFTSVSTSGVTFGISVDGGAGVIISQVAAGLTASSHTPSSGTILVASLAAGAHTIQAQWRRTAGAGTLTRDSGDWLTISCLETQA